MPAVIPIAAAVVGAAASAYSANKSAKAQAKAVSDTNAANKELHTMTPEEKRNFLSEGFNKINQGFTGSTELASRNLASRGLGGNAVAAPLANIGRSRAQSIGDLYANLVKTAMNMKAGTPNALVVPPAPGFGTTFATNILQSVGGSLSGAAGSQLGTQFAKLF